MSKYPTISQWEEGTPLSLGSEEGLYKLKDANGRAIATLETSLDGTLTVRAYSHTLLIKPMAANSVVITFER